METRAIPGIVVCALLIAGCETPLPSTIPTPEEPAAKVSEGRKTAVSVVSEYRPAPDGLERALNKCKEALAMAQARMAELERQIAQSHDTETRLQADLLAANKTVEELQQANRLGSRRAEDLQLQAQESERELSRRKAALADSTRHLTALEQDREKIALALAESTRQLSALEQDKQKVALALAEAQGQLQQLNQSIESIKQSLAAEIAKRDILIRELRGQVVITMLDRLLFDSGQTTIKPTALKSLSEVSTMLKQAADKEIRVEGHTDNRPIHGPLAQRFPTNWELSTARAISVVRYLVDHAGVDPARLSAGGYADTRPMATNDTEEGRSQNRRIEIVLYPKGLPRASDTQAPGAPAKPD